MKKVETIKNIALKAEVNMGINIVMMDSPVAQDYIVTINPGEDVIASPNSIKMVDMPRFSLGG